MLERVDRGCGGETGKNRRVTSPLTGDKEVEREDGRQQSPVKHHTRGGIKSVNYIGILEKITKHWATVEATALIATCCQRDDIMINQNLLRCLATDAKYSIVVLPNTAQSAARLPPKDRRKKVVNLLYFSIFDCFSCENLVFIVLQ